MADQTVTLRLSANAGGLIAGVGTAKREVGELGAAGAAGGRHAAEGMSAARKEVTAIGEQLNAARRQIVAFAAGFIGIQTARQFARLADEASNVRAQLQLASRSQVEYARAQSETFAIAQRTSTALDATANLYARITRSTSEYGVEQARVLAITETINQTFAVSGTAAAAQANAITQLTQAFAGGVLRAEEFNSVIENSPRLAQALADGMGVGIGKLRELVNDGEVTVDRMIAALESQAAAVEEEFSRMPLTIERAWVQLENATLGLVGTLDAAGNASAGVAAYIQDIATAISLVSPQLAELTSGWRGNTAAQDDSAASARGVAEAMKTVVTGLVIAKNVVDVLVDGFRAMVRVAVAAAAGVADAFRDVASLPDIVRRLATPLTARGALKDLEEVFDRATSRSERFMAEAGSAAAEFGSAFTKNVGDVSKAFGFLLEPMGEVPGAARSGAEAGEQLAASLTGAGNSADSAKVALESLLRVQRQFEQERDRELAMAEEAAGSASAMIDGLRDEAKQAGLTEVERRRLAETRAFDAAMQAAQAARTPEQLAALRAEFEAAMKVRDASELVAEQQELTSEAAKRAAEDSARAWTDFAQGLSRAVLDGSRGVKRYFKQLLDDLKAQILGSGLLNLFAGIFGGAFSGAGAAAAQGGPLSMLGAMFGLGGGGSGARGGGGLGGLLGAVSGGRNLLSLISGGIGGGVFNLGTSLFGSGIGLVSNFGGGLATAGANILGNGFFGSMGANLSGGFGSLFGGNIMAGIGQLAGVIGPILGGLSLIDSISGGRLFGTSWSATGGGRDIAIGPGGASGSEFVTESRRRSLFRGTARRTRREDLDDETQAAIDDLYQGIADAMAAAAAQLGSSTVPEMIAGSFRQEFDKNGKLVREFSTIAGRVYNESQEAFAQRLGAENIIATIDAALGTTVQAVIGGIGDGIERGSPELGERIGELIGSLIPKDGPGGTGTVGEASAIAERWRSDAELLAEGAQFLLMAATDIRRGTGLLGEGGTLTQIADLMEDLQAPGESLAQTYARVAASTALLDQALALSRVSLEGTREQFVRLATDVVEAMGGLDRAAALVSNYANRFYTDAERARAAVTAARANATTQFADIDLDYTQFMGEGGMQAFREMFERLLPTLSAEAIAQWYEAAEALGIVIDATDAYVASMTAQARAQASIIGEINAGIADLTMTDYERQVAGIEGQTRSYVEALVEAGMTMEQATTHALRWRDAQMGALEAQRQAARTSITDEMADSVADVGRSDWERQMVALDRRAQDYITALVETGVALDAATAAANAWRDSMRAALEEQRRGNFIDQLDDIDWEQSLAGMSAYDRQVATINRRYDELYATAVELGLGEDELLRIRRLQRGELDALASSTENASRALAQLGLAMVDAGGAVLGTEDARRSWTDIIAEATGVARGDSMSAEQRAIAQVNERFQRFASSITEGYQQGRLGAIIAGNVEQFDREYLDRISQLEALRIEALANLRNDLDRQRFEREEAWVKRLLGLRDSLLLDEQLSTLTPAERVSEAQRQYDAAVSAIQAAAQTTATDDDEAARGAFESVARTLLREGRTSFGSDYRYDALLAQVLGDIDRFIADSPITVGQRVAEQAMQVVIPEGSLKLDTQPVELLLTGLRNDQDEQTRALIEELREVRRELADIKTSNRLIADNTRAEFMPVRAV